MNNSVLAITGGIGSGKSVVSHLLEIMGIPVYNCDLEAKRLNESHPEIRRELSDLVGPEVYDADGRLNKQVLGAFLFRDTVHAEKVNRIIHPRVKEDFVVWCSAHSSCPWIGIESAILYESGFQELADKTLLVYAPEEVRLRRVMERDGVKENEIRKRMAHQMSDEQKRRMVSYVVENDGTRPLIPQILDILALLPCPYQP